MAKLGTIFTMQTPATLHELKEFIEKAERFSEGDDNMTVRIIDKELRLRWPAEDGQNA